jgi:hypothetical protein
MLGRGKIASVLTAALLLAPAVAQAQRPEWRVRQQQRQARREQRKQQQARAAGHPAQNQPGHAGYWLRRYKDLPPEQQRRSLENDPQFRKLPPPRQAQMLQRLQQFSSLPPQAQERILRRMEIWEHLTPEQKRQGRELHWQLQQLPPDRRQAINRALLSMRNLTPEQREQRINSGQFDSEFSPQERSLLRGASRLPLAPSDGFQPEAPEE